MSEKLLKEFMQQIKGRSLVFHLSDIVRYSIKALVKYTCNR